MTVFVQQTWPFWVVTVTFLSIARLTQIVFSLIYVFANPFLPKLMEINRLINRVIFGSVKLSKIAQQEEHTLHQITGTTPFELPIDNAKHVKFTDYSLKYLYLITHYSHPSTIFFPNLMYRVASSVDWFQGMPVIHTVQLENSFLEKKHVSIV